MAGPQISSGGRESKREYGQFAMHSYTPISTMRLIATLVSALSAAGCSSELAQKATDRKEMGRQLTGAYYTCVRTSFASQRPTMVDRNMAIDQAFMVCRTEEAKLQAFESSENPNVNIANHRNALKEELLRR
jgi:hypothetical protein